MIFVRSADWAVRHSPLSVERQVGEPELERSLPRSGSNPRALSPVGTSWLGMSNKLGNLKPHFPGHRECCGHEREVSG